MHKRLVRFDWAMKRMLRHKANFVILEGFLSELLGFDVFIESILESEGNKQTEHDKFNRVDILVKAASGQLMLIEVQNDSEADYFHRMMYGVSKLATEYIKEGEPYGTIKKIYSINIVYFGLGQGKDYIYEYKGEFVGMHLGDILEPTPFQKQTYQVSQVSDIFPKYYLLKVNNFDDIAKDRLDEWVYFLKHNEVQEGFKAKGLQAVKERLVYDSLSDLDKDAYNRYQENRRIEKSVTETAKEEGRKEGMKEGIKEGQKQAKLDLAQAMKTAGEPLDKIILYTGLTETEIQFL